MTLLKMLAGITRGPIDRRSPIKALCRMADAIGFAVSPAGVDEAHAPFDAVFSALKRSFSRLSSAWRHTSPVAAAQAAAMRRRARFMFIAIATN